MASSDPVKRAHTSIIQSTLDSVTIHNACRQQRFGGKGERFGGEGERCRQQRAKQRRAFVVNVAAAAVVNSRSKEMKEALPRAAVALSQRVTGSASLISFHHDDGDRNV